MHQRGGLGENEMDTADVVAEGNRHGPACLATTKITIGPARRRAYLFCVMGSGRSRVAAWWWCCGKGCSHMTGANRVEGNSRRACKDAG